MKTPRFWQQRGLASTLLTPLALLYRIGAWHDRAHTTPQRAPRPVIAIGNVTAGGAGKTPATLALVPLLRTLGHTPHILTRGYKGAAQTAHRVLPTDPWQTVGDEALLLATAAPTWVGSSRFTSAHAAADTGATLLVCDDALQHHALHKDLALLVIDGPYGIGNGQLLPAGPLREPLTSATARCDAALLVGDDPHGLAATLPIPVFHATLQPTGDTRFLTHGSWLAFAGIGRPQKFYDSLRQLGANLAATQDFADHHAYSAAEIDSLLAHARRIGATLITTAKDAVKLPSEYHASIRVLPIELVLDDPAAFIHFLATRLPPASGT